MKKYLLCLMLISIFSCGALLGFSQDVSAFRPSFQHISEEEVELQATAKDMVKQLKDGNWFDFMYACQAVRENDLSACDRAKDPEKCINGTKDLLEIRGVADGSCKNLKEFPEDVCFASSEGNCSSLTGDKASICSAINKRNDDLLYKAGRRILELDSLSEATDLLNLYYGFKHYSESACDRFKSSLKGGSYDKKMACKVLFGPKDPQETIDNTILDLAYLQYVKEVKNDLSVCEIIKDSTIRKACENPKVKNIVTFFQTKR